MTLEELIKDIDMHLPGNRFDSQAKTMWINEIEGKIFDEIEAPAIRAGSREIRNVYNNGSDTWEYTKGSRPVKLEERSDEEESSDTGSSDDTADTDDTSDGSDKPKADPCYCLEAIDPLNMHHCCGGRNRQVLELIPYRYPEDKDRKLICPDRFCDVYVHYVLSKMHAADSETADYNNEVLLYDASYKDYAAWSIRNFKRVL